MPKEMQEFYNSLRGYEPLRRLFRMVMDNLVENNFKNAVFFGEKLYTLSDKSSVSTYLLGRIRITQANATLETETF